MMRKKPMLAYPVSDKSINYDKVFNYLDKVPISVLGYGPQGRSQALNMLNNGLNVSLGIRKNGESYKKAKADGWLENENLFDIEEAASRGRIIKYLLSDNLMQPFFMYFFNFLVILQKIEMDFIRIYKTICLLTQQMK